LNKSYYIARRLIKSAPNRKKATQNIVHIATAGTVLSTIIMVLTVFISSGFKKNIEQKVRGFSSDLEIVSENIGETYDYKPIQKTDVRFDDLKKLSQIKQIKAFITKPAIIKHQQLIEGIVLKSYAQESDYHFFKSNLTLGRLPNFEQNEVLISSTMANKLHLSVDSSVIIYFIQEPIKFRKAKISGIYNTDVFELDKLFVICGSNLLQKVNAWNAEQFSGYEIELVEKSSHIESIKSVIKPQWFDPNNKPTALSINDLQTRYPEFYYWFSLFDTNVTVIISLMVAVAGINLISALLIVIIENKNTIALLKAIGGDNRLIRGIFLHIALFLTARGLLIGNFIAIIISYLQVTYRIIPLDAENYYISFIPIHFDWMALFWLNLVTFFAIFLLLILPSNYIARIAPNKVLRYN